MLRRWLDAAGCSAGLFQSEVMHASGEYLIDAVRCRAHGSLAEAISSGFRGPSSPTATAARYRWVMKRPCRRGRNSLADFARGIAGDTPRRNKTPADRGSP